MSLKRFSQKLKPKVRKITSAVSFTLDSILRNVNFQIITLLVHLLEGFAILKMWGKDFPDTLNVLLHKGFTFLAVKDYCSHVFYHFILFLWKSSWFYIKAALKISWNPATKPMLVKLLQSFTKYFLKERN